MTTIQYTFALTQQAMTLAGDVPGVFGGVRANGTVEPNGDFVLTSEPFSITVDGCTVASTAEHTGNLLTGDVEASIMLDTSGSCSSISDCQFTWNGSIEPTSIAPPASTASALSAETLRGAAAD